MFQILSNLDKNGRNAPIDFDEFLDLMTARIVRAVPCRAVYSTVLVARAFNRMPRSKTVQGRLVAITCRVQYG